MIYYLESKPWDNFSCSYGYSTPGWYFCDESYYYNGPYDSEEEAKNKLNEYSTWLHKGNPDYGN